MEPLSNENIAAVCQEAEAFLEKHRVARKEALRLRLSMEEMLLRYQKKLGSDAGFAVEFGKRLGRVKIRLLVPGSMMDPLNTPEDADPAEDLMRRTLQNMGQLPTWNYARGRNVVLFTLEKRSMPEWMRLLVAISGAMLCGLLIRLAPETLRILVHQEIVTPLMEKFLGFLNAVAGPMIFLSAVWGICSIGDATTFSVLGSKLAGRYMLNLFLATGLSAALSIPFFHLNMGGSQESTGFSPLLRMVLDIVPSNLIAPFVQGNTLQILFIAIVMGITMILLGEKSQQVTVLTEQLGNIVNYIMSFVCKLVPFFVFGSLFSIVIGDDFGLLLNAGKFFFGTVAGCLAILLAHTLASSLMDRISPLELWKHCSSTFLIGLTTASSAAAFSDNLKTCTEKLGIDEKLANFAVPFGQVLYKPSATAAFWFAAISVAEQSGVTISVTWIVTALVVCVVLSAATPPVPGGGTASFAILFSQLGLPLDSLGMILAANALLDFILTATVLFGGQCTALDASVRFGMNRDR